MLAAVLDIAPGCRFVRGRSRARPAGAAPRDAEDETAASMRSRGASTPRRRHREAAALRFVRRIVRIVARLQRISA
ncbi:hypothetical protein [Burkholderia thailandensis]|uniref:hypothetical protein n=1 Tax=Burkholderia thailandensis TaxID=57975 RepID=UPI0012D370F1|nr:hypothetical protein [Burkholderia thailandensis]MCS6423526.1 hypothetical protein [Burkholderia thailandensis]MCS6451222.1 hypothetical protein [Burkholderia thailandensis]MCS6463083.1 hypothetical protein [Burkholderia thailandensis]MCS6480882.1 hypothetical protein [Burkholderia thailandensis]MCZ2894063.1 hypothetical protein [Burkholderia thailandensis]